MDFARKILGKYGWKEGDGLGKNNNGIAKPLKATLKFDNAGFGANQAASDFNNHWWERVYNDAAGNLNVKKEGESVQMALVDSEEEVEISTKSYSMKKLKKAKLSRLSSTKQGAQSSYDNFLQAATLNNTGGEVLNPDRIDVSDIEVTKVNVLTDEELFKACGGRTAHKGARHGLKLSGKLARLEQQEEELLAKMLGKQNGVAETRNSEVTKTREETGVIGVSKKQKKRKMLAEESTEAVTNHEIQNRRTKKKKMLEKSEQQEENPIITGCESIDNRKRKKKKKEENKMCVIYEDIPHKKLKKAKKKI